MKLIPLKYDFCIKEVMDNEIVRKHFISDVLEILIENIKSVRIASPVLWTRRKKEKLGILDVQLTMNDSTKINIEMQLKHHPHWENRTVFYLAKMFTADLRRGEKYKRLKKCVAITILDFKLDNRKEYHNVYMLRDKDGDLYTDILELHTIELTKPPNREKPNPLDEWHSLFNAKTEEDLDMIKRKTRNLGIIEAIKELKTMSLSDRLWYIHEQRLKEKRDREWIEDEMYEEGLQKGIEKGRETEKEKNINSFVKSFRRNGHTDKQIVSELMIEYGLSLEEAEKKLK
ncbi:MAG: Rpn family recombination-promoting nuclease/putative transposase [Lachnospiraceae bacterium]|nr:Rpn family recombination-promoting nuclease/putative transposase [Lachnospiraceae bacterium]